MGVGGFMARTRSRGNQRGSRGSRGGAPFGRGGLLQDPTKKRRPAKRPGLEDGFPAYLQEAFFGRPILDSTDDDKLDLGDESYTADIDGGLESSVAEIKSSIQVKYLLSKLNVIYT